ncbi:ribbon-helix-helix protein, CopG family [Sphingopyxis sp. BSNA05]|uniref:ribbon-helix-helix protein, CopG family n=1 Tax=Sphingopyxis sp. BSNA05 TaxID=1236614 RepID=UPI001C25565F|nr:ribbon-helix-helix protein, CopG family [Sphingopyxis sp. BSNA05]
MAVKSLGLLGAAFKEIKDMSGDKPSPGRRLKRISIAVQDDQYIGLEEVAEDMGVTIADAAREAINSYLLTEHWGHTVGKLAELEIGNGLTNEEVLAKVLAKFPHAQTSRDSVAWYRSKMRKVNPNIPTDREARVRRES